MGVMDDVQRREVSYAQYDGQTGELSYVTYDVPETMYERGMPEWKARQFDGGHGRSSDEPGRHGAEPVPFTVVVRRSFEVKIAVNAEDAERAVDAIDRVSFELPSLDQWTGVKDFWYRVLDADGSEVYERE